MGQNESTAQLINFMLQPSFTVKDGVIDAVNEAARSYTLEAGQSVSDMLVTGKTEYRELTTGCLYLTLSVQGVLCGASVRRMEEFDLFTLEQESDEAELQGMALAAQELRAPLSGVMAIADQLFPVTDEGSDPATADQIARINRGLFQMLRIVSNMSDVYRYCQQTEQRYVTVELTSFLQEIFDKVRDMLSLTSITLTFENLERPIHTLIEPEKLERAIHNIVSNAVKFSAKGSPVHAKLTCRGTMLYLSVCDSGEGIHPEVQGTIHSRFRRMPGLEDRRFGIGLGMVMIRSAAAAHGGTVLIDHPEDCGTRLTMTIAIRQNAESIVRSNVLRVDYAGERDHLLLELSEVLPAELYRKERIN
ncbi:MAG: HAMP domain-containing histidine kinase [Ruminococcaceae bacterium]|nr:HAMP domain-containing histidine kinase [Oscillospiraceae bacterium]